MNEPNVYGIASTFFLFWKGGGGGAEGRRGCWRGCSTGCKKGRTFLQTTPTTPVFLGKTSTAHGTGGAKALALMNGTGGTRKRHFNYFCKHSLRELVRTARYPARAHAENRNGRDCGYVHLRGVPETEALRSGSSATAANHPPRLRHQGTCNATTSLNTRRLSLNTNFENAFPSPLSRTF